MITISLCMIVKNEEAVLEQCLNTVKDITDEIIIVDTGSIDNTKEIALKFTDKVYDFEWIDDFSAARNFSFDKAEMEYILWLDADDIIKPEDAAKLKKLKDAMPNEIDVVMMKYNTAFDQNGKATFSYFRERLVKKSKNFKWREPVHECLDMEGNVINVDICVTHTEKKDKISVRNIRIYENLLRNGVELTPRGMYYFSRELNDHERYSEAVEWYNKFLDMGKGWLEDKINACSDLSKCYQAENKQEAALTALFRSFEYDVPRAEICCQIGYYFKSLEKYKQAAFWFELVFGLKNDENNWGFRREDCRGYIPCIELAVCYDRLGDYEKAASYNDRASEYKPDAAPVLHNKKYFDIKLGKV